MCNGIEAFWSDLLAPPCGLSHQKEVLQPDVPRQSLGARLLCAWKPIDGERDSDRPRPDGSDASRSEPLTPHSP